MIINISKPCGCYTFHKTQKKTNHDTDDAMDGGRMMDKQEYDKASDSNINLLQERMKEIALKESKLGGLSYLQKRKQGPKTFKL